MYACMPTYTHTCVCMYMNVCMCAYVVKGRMLERRTRVQILALADGRVLGVSYFSGMEGRGRRGEVGGGALEGNVFEHEQVVSKC